MVGGRPSIGLPTRGLRGLAVIIASVAAVVGVVLGGVAGVNALANSGDPDPSTNAALTSTNLPTPTAEPSAAEEPTPSATKKLKNTETTEAAEEAPVRTRTVTKEADPTKSPTAKKQTEQEKEKAQEAADKAEESPGTVTKRIGVIRNLVTSYCVDLPGLGAVSENVPLLQTNCYPGKTDNQAYETITQADGTFLLRNVKSQWCLDVPAGGAVDAGTTVVTYTCKFGSDDNQMYKKQAAGNGFFLVNVKTGLCLDPEGTDATNSPVDTQLALNPCSETDNHIWSFDRS
nr:RICIN domain-containing protein [Kineosporia babensis]